ncbi:MAG TPA: GNAT family N-acetyltransferase [Thermoanaerobaculia bacterium]|nr:GNAT family N-acetyltransferase [Thermoanaerobaculia bacterium]
MSYDIRNNETASQFETTVDGHTAVAAYSLTPGTNTFTHTAVPDALAGRGIAGELARHALGHARAQNLRVVPQCSYIAAFIQRHSEYQDLVNKR